MTAVIINILALGTFVVAFYRNRQKALGAIKVAVKMFVSLLPMLIIIITLIGLLFGFVSEEGLRQFLGDQSGPLGVLTVAVLGAVLHIPALLAFPLSASLLDMGASVTVIATFITTLTMIGVVTLPLEIEALGGRFAALRNGTSFMAALIISLLMGLVI